MCQSMLNSLAVSLSCLSGFDHCVWTDQLFWAPYAWVCCWYAAPNSWGFNDRKDKWSPLWLIPHTLPICLSLAQSIRCIYKAACWSVSLFLFYSITSRELWRFVFPRGSVATDQALIKVFQNLLEGPANETSQYENIAMRKNNSYRKTAATISHCVS